MLHQKKIKGFTLSETLVALVLMVLIVGIASTVISLTSQNIAIIKENENGYRDLEQLELLLELDLSRYKTVKYQNNIISFSNEINSIEYQIKTKDTVHQYLIRENDTVLQGEFLALFYLNGFSVTNGDLDALEIKMKKNEQIIFIAKKTDIDQTFEDGF